MPKNDIFVRNWFQISSIMSQHFWKKTSAWPKLYAEWKLKNLVPNFFREINFGRYCIPKMAILLTLEPLIFLFLDFLAISQGGRFFLKSKSCASLICQKLLSRKNEMAENWSYFFTVSWKHCVFEKPTITYWQSLLNRVRKSHLPFASSIYYDLRH